LASIKRLYNMKLGEIYPKSSTQVFRFEKFIMKKEFDIWREDISTGFKYLGYRPVFEYFHDKLMKLPVIARQLPKEGIIIQRFGGSSS
jgi:hypothetical protein